MADKTIDEVQAHHRRLADGLIQGSEYSRVLEAVRSSLSSTYPHLAQSPGLLEQVAQADAYQEWRKHRCFDHSTVWPGAQMPDGTLGFALMFYEGPHSPLMRGTHLSRTELEELRDQINDALEAQP